MSHKEIRYIIGTAWYATSVGARTLLSHMSWSAENSQDVGLRLVEELPIAAERPERVLRGGSWDFDPQNARVADRDSFSPGYRDGNLGFRLVEVTDD